MDPITAAALITGGTQMIGSFIGGRRAANVSRTNTDKTIAANKQMAELKWKRDLDMWEMMKKYNDPTSQMQRFKEAGLNPHLIYGQGTPGNVQSAPTYQPPSIQFNYQADQGLPSAMQNLPDPQGLMMKQREIEGKVAKNELTGWNARIAKLNGNFLARENEIDQIVFSENKFELIEKRVKEWKAELSSQQLKNAQIELSNYYQQRVNDLIDKGMTPGDSVKLRIGMTILEALGVSQQKLKQILGGI